MQIIGKITSISPVRTFTRRDTSGNSSEGRVVDVTIEGVSDSFFASAYDKDCDELLKQGALNATVVADVRCWVNNYKTKEGDSRLEQRVTLNRVQVLRYDNTNQVF